MHTINARWMEPASFGSIAHSLHYIAIIIIILYDDDNFILSTQSVCVCVCAKMWHDLFSTRTLYCLWKQEKLAAKKREMSPDKNQWA